MVLYHLGVFWGVSSREKFKRLCSKPPLPLYLCVCLDVISLFQWQEFPPGAHHFSPQTSAALFTEKHLQAQGPLRQESSPQNLLLLTSPNISMFYMSIWDEINQHGLKWASSPALQVCATLMVVFLKRRAAGRLRTAPVLWIKLDPFVTIGRWKLQVSTNERSSMITYLIRQLPLPLLSNYF